MSILGITCLRDDGPYVTEWIAHHLAAGVDRMLVFTHDCTDGSDVLLDALARDPRIAHVPFTPKGRKSVQWQALKLAREHPWVQDCDWALFFDCDEYLCLPEGGSLPEVVAALDADLGAFDALALPWRLFGSGLQERRTEGLTPERFTLAAPQDLHFPLAHLFKSLFRPKAFRQFGVHRPRGKPSKPARWIGPDGRELSDGFAQADGAISLYGTGQGAPRLWLNHYSLRSREEFLVKRARGLPNHMDREIGLTYWAERNWNSVEAREIFPMLAATHDRLAQVMELPQVADIQHAILQEHGKRYQDQMGNLETLRLSFRLGLLTGSSPPSAAGGQAFLQAQMQLIAEKSKA